jgi:hypothetical protein
MAFSLFKFPLTEYEKYLLEKKEERATILFAIKKLFVKPHLVNNFTINEIYVIHINILCNYLLEKLSLCNYTLYLKYQELLKNLIDSVKFLGLEMKHFIITDINLYKLLWDHLKIYNSNNFDNDFDYNILFKNIKEKKKIKSLISIFELFVSPLYFIRREKIPLYFFKLNEQKIKFKKKRFKRPSTQMYFKRKFQFFKFRVTKPLILLRRYLSKEDYKKLQILRDPEFKYDKKKAHIRVDLRKIPENIYFLENLLILQNIIDNPFQYIHILNYYSFLKLSHLSNLEIFNQLKYAKLHNNTLLKTQKKNKYKIINNFILKKDLLTKYKLIYNDLNFAVIKYIESKKILGEIVLYLEYTFKTVFEFIENFLFKFSKVMNIVPLLDLFYEGVKNQPIFFDFYNLLSISLKKIKLQFNVYTITFIVDFLELIYYLHFFAGKGMMLFTRSLKLLSNLGIFSELRIFKFNYWVRFHLFSFNDNTFIYDYFFNIYSYSNISIFFYYYFDLFNLFLLSNVNINKVDYAYLSNERLVEVDGLNLFSNITIISKYLDSFKNMRIFDLYKKSLDFRMVLRLKRIQKKYLKFNSKKIRDRLFKNHFKQKIKIIKNNIKFLKKKNYYSYKKKKVLKKNDLIFDFRLFRGSILRNIRKKKLFFTLPIIRSYNLIKLKETHLIINSLKIFNNARNREVLKFNFETFRKKLKYTLKKYYELRLEFLIDLMDQKKNIKLIDFNQMNFWNLSNFQLPEDWDDIDANIINFYQFFLTSLQTQFIFINFKGEDQHIKYSPKTITSEPYFSEEAYILRHKKIGGARK